ncbi:hypothetical protein CKAH01_12927 [Colletotrichum kahawae]|uniref:Uncharacterized protein n=1 Tax=Colletotrichum kahawae TaxID=34407 RepID=A0AAE0DEI4_COLKA|nr:hypothetical protein CKAH01_12927 [Colletotrichum kahawae]
MTLPSHLASLAERDACTAWRRVNSAALQKSPLPGLPSLRDIPWTPEQSHAASDNPPLVRNRTRIITSAPASGPTAILRQVWFDTEFRPTAVSPDAAADAAPRRTGVIL